ncbi:ATP-dependent helicase [Mycoplasmoides alvi]|uniref:ATP-dependent helicase n=1 Tax=Mycoplasmoides alvi TaxID=78580 RepID=UPI0006963D5E|nr:UvrD-helicase domain-containing protein [Mycoplasmoides alvi]
MSLEKINNFFNKNNDWNLNKQQENVVFAPKNENSLVISGAGTGKTKVLVYRIVNLIKSYNIDPNRILAITFSKKATDEIKTRIQKELNSSIELKWINTFHAFCFKVLKHEIHKLNYSINFSIIDSEDKKSIFNFIFQDKGLNREILKLNLVIKYIEICKSKNIEIDNFLDEYKIFYKLNKSQCDLLKNVFKEYNLYLKENNYLDFADLLNFTFKIFKKFPDISEKWSKNFDYILIDEFQDTDDIQYFIMKSIINSKNNIFVVGDPDQSIYGWRNANAKNIDIFKNDFPNSSVYYLEQNYRSSQQILNVANDIIKNNKTNLSKNNLFSHKKNGPLPKYFLAQNQDLESTWIVKNIKKIIANNKDEKYKNIAILYRSNFLSRNIEHALVQNNIPYYIYGSIKFYQRKEIKDLIAYLKVINNKDEISLIRIINIPSRKVTDKTIQKLKIYSEQHKITIYESLKYVHEINIYKPAINHLLEFYELLENLRIKNTSKNLKISDLLKEIIKKINYKAEFDEKLEIDRLKNIDELINSIEKYESENDNFNLENYLENIQLLSNDNAESKHDSVQLMTIHSAKGLEFDYVFIYGLIENIFPSILQNNHEEITNEKIEEERRIMYVAVTRAKKELFMTSSLGIDFNHNSKLPSRFISEINSNNLETTGFTNLKQIQENKNDWFDSKKSINYKDMFYDNMPTYMLHDKIFHSKFGEGIVIKIKNKTIVVAFALPIGVKEIMKNHTSITRKSE